MGRMPYWKYATINWLEKIVGEQRIFEHFDKHLSKYSDAEADYYVPRNGYNYAVYDADVFREPKMVDFEDHKLPAPTRPEKYLRTHYGIDWFNLPPVAARYSTHFTLSSDCFTPADFMAQFNWLNSLSAIHRVHEKKHKYQIKRFKPMKKVNLYLAKLKAIADELELNSYLAAIDRGHIQRLADNNQYE